VRAAADLADEVGPDTLTLSLLAQRLGVRQPSLYKHVQGLPDLRRQMAVLAKEELAQVLGEAVAGRAGRDALHALALAYHDWAMSRPGRYAATQRAPRAGDRTDEGASAAVMRVVADALRGYDLDEDTLVDATRTLRAIVHGFVALEQIGGFGMPRHIDASLAFALDCLEAALEPARTRAPD
jgi:AcrR family transcriptional regulator